MKPLLFLFALFFVNLIYSQSPCSAQYDYTMAGDSNTCVYTITPVLPLSHPSICSITWTIASHGTYGIACDPAEMEADPLTYSFCFDGYYDVKMIIHFCSGQSCYVIHTVYVRCLGATTCDPDPDRITSIPNPYVTITYLQPDTCNYNSTNPVSGCMNKPNGTGGYFVSCGWQWAIRVPPTNCNYFEYYVQYDSIRGFGNYSCVTRYIIDSNFICINAYIDRPIYIVATAKNCCLPANYQRGYYWTPTPAQGLYNIIDDPTPTVSTDCSAYRHCDDYTYCPDNPIEMDQPSGWPATCFWGGSKIDERLKLNSNDLLIIEQDIRIYSIDGKELYRGKWKFGKSSDYILDWPTGIKSGLYMVNFGGKFVTKLLKP